VYFTHTITHNEQRKHRNKQNQIRIAAMIKYVVTKKCQET